MNLYQQLNSLPTTIASARMIQAKAMFSVYDSKASSFKPFFEVHLTVMRPDRYRIDAIPQSKLADGSKTPSFYFCDGKTQYEYNSLSGKYAIADAPRPGERPISQLFTMAGMKHLLSPGMAARAGMTRTVREEYLEGQKRIVVTDTEPPRQGSANQAYTQLWIDPITGLPVQVIDGLLEGGRERPNLRLTYVSWSFNKPVPAALWVWKVPKNATSSLLLVGALAPDFDAIKPDGSLVRLSDLKGKILILDFWATWCGPCKASMPHLQKVYEAVKDKDIAVLALCVWDERPNYEKWVLDNKDKYQFPTALDTRGRAKGNVAERYLVSGIPTQYVIGRDGRVVASFVGFEGAGDHRLESVLEKLGIR